MLIIDDKVKSKYCGTTGPLDYVSHSKSGLKIVFKSNKKKVFKGFTCDYESIKGKPTTTKSPTASSTTVAPTTTTISPTSAKLLEDAISKFNSGKN